MTNLFEPGDRIDITISGAEVVDHGPTRLTIGLPGLPGTYVLPTRDNRAREVLVLTRTAPQPQAGELYLAGGQPDRRLFAVYNPYDRAVQLVDPLTGEWFWPAAAVEMFGTLHLSVPMPEPEPPTARDAATMPILQGPGAEEPLKSAPVA